MKHMQCDHVIFTAEKVLTKYMVGFKKHYSQKTAAVFVCGPHITGLCLMDPSGEVHPGQTLIVSDPVATAEPRVFVPLSAAPNMFRVVSISTGDL